MPWMEPHSTFLSGTAAGKEPGSGCNADRRCKADIPGQQLRDTIDGMVGDAADHLAQVGFGIEAVEQGEFDGQVARRRMKTRQLCCPPPKCGANRCHCRKLNPASK